MAAAAIAGARAAKKRQQGLKIREKKEKDKINGWFRKYDTNKSGVLERDQLKQLLLDNQAPYDPEPDDECLDALMKMASEVDTTGDGVADSTGVSKDSLSEVVSKHHKYMKEKAAIDRIFREFDTNGSGVLERDQLRSLMAVYEPELKIEQGDVDYVLENVDVSATGTILPREVLPAIAVWKALAKEKSSQICSIS